MTRWWSASPASCAPARRCWTSAPARAATRCLWPCAAATSPPWSLRPRWVRAFAPWPPRPASPTSRSSRPRGRRPTSGPRTWRSAPTCSTPSATPRRSSASWTATRAREGAGHRAHRGSALEGHPRRGAPAPARAQGAAGTALRDGLLPRRGDAAGPAAPWLGIVGRGEAAVHGHPVRHPWQRQRSAPGTSDARAARADRRPHLGARRSAWATRPRKLAAW